ncbi:MAG: hypothetical protein SVG88_14955 [Halobacteriales archaeon]|nr:hypothetical protein [Halobacteriales archaeon]
MVAIVSSLALIGYAAGAVGGVLLFIEFFQTPSYITYDTDFNDYNMNITPTDVQEFTWFGRIGALLLALGFALNFLATLLRSAAVAG